MSAGQPDPAEEDRGGKGGMTTYVILDLVPDSTHGPAWIERGEYVVPQGRSDQAKRQALKDLYGSDPAESYTLVAIPKTSWRPEVFELERAEPQWKGRATQA